MRITAAHAPHSTLSWRLVCFFLALFNAACGIGPNTSIMSLHCIATASPSVVLVNGPTNPMASHIVLNGPLWPFWQSSIACASSCNRVLAISKLSSSAGVEYLVNVIGATCAAMASASDFTIFASGWKTYGNVYSWQRVTSWAKYILSSHCSEF